jgi:hypothetical protein
MEETLERSQGPPQAVAPLDRERERVILHEGLLCKVGNHKVQVGNASYIRFK